MQCDFSPASPMPRPAPLVLLNRHPEAGTAHQAALSRLCFGPLESGHEGAASWRLAAVSSLRIGGIAPGQLRRIRVGDGRGEVLCLGSIDSQAGRAVTAGDMLLAMARMAGTDGLWLDLRGVGLHWEHLAVELLAEGRCRADAGVEVLAVLQPVERSALTALREADRPGPAPTRRAA